ncbi:hypothetical protein NFI96_030157, partial [Prochilodus magdalenae]
MVEETQKRTPSVMTSGEEKTCNLPTGGTMACPFPRNQVYMEFTGIDLKQYFYEGLDQHNSRLVEVFRTKRGLAGQILSKFLRTHSLQLLSALTSEPTVLRTLALRGLPVMLGDNPEDFFKTCFCADEEQTFSSTATGILIVEHDEGGHHLNSLGLNPLSVGFILE